MADADKDSSDRTQLRRDSIGGTYTVRSYITVALVIILVLIIIWAVLRYADNTYTLALLLPEDDELTYGLETAWVLGLSDGGAKNLRIIKHRVNNTPEDMVTAVRNVVENVYCPKNRTAFVVGFTTSQLHAVLNYLNKIGRTDILCISPGSTATTIPKGSNAIQAVHSDDFSRTAIQIFLRLDKAQSVTLVWKIGDEYSESYCRGLAKDMRNQDIAINGSIGYDGTNATDVATTMVKSSHVIIPMFSKDITEIALALRNIKDGNRPTIVAGDSASDLRDIFPPEQKCVVVVPATVDYTDTTRSLVKRIGNHVGFMTPFNYDCAYQIAFMTRNNLDLTWDNFEMAGDTWRPRAAVVSSWYKKDKMGPSVGGYWFIHTHDPQMGAKINEFRNRSLGYVFTLPQSAAAPFHIGNFVWAGSLGWNIYQNLWEEMSLPDGKKITKLSYESVELPDITINWAPNHVKLARDRNGKWYTAKLVTEGYPLSTAKYVMI